MQGNYEVMLYKAGVCVGGNVWFGWVQQYVKLRHYAQWSLLFYIKIIIPE